MEGQRSASVFVLVPADEDLVEGDVIAIRHRYNVCVDVRAALVQMYNKRQDVLLPESASEDIVHVLCPALDFRTSLDRAVVGTFLIVDLLVAKRQLAQTLVRAADDEVHDGPVFRIVGPFLVGILDPSRGDVL